MAKGRKVNIKQKGLFEAIFGCPRKIVLRPGEFIAEFREKSTGQTWLEVHKRPDDGLFRHDKLGKTFLMDSDLSSNGGQFHTFDVDHGAQVGYEMGLIAVPHILEPASVKEVLAVDGTVTQVQVPAKIRMEVVETREWVGISGTRTYINEDDESFKQLNASLNAKMMKMVQTCIFITGVALIITALVHGFTFAKMVPYLPSIFPHHGG